MRIKEREREKDTFSFSFCTTSSLKARLNDSFTCQTVSFLPRFAEIKSDFERFVTK